MPVYKIEYTDGTTNGAGNANFFGVATENYVNVTSKAACYAATTGTALAATYNNGTSGAGATLTASSNGAFVLDGLASTFFAIGNRILVKDQGTTNAFQNGIYQITNLGSSSSAWVLTRTTDYDSPYLVNPGDFIVVIYGNTNGDTAYIETQSVPAIGTSSITFSLISGAASVLVQGTANQIVATPNGSAVALSIANNPTIPGNAGIVIPIGTTAQRPVSPVAGTLRINNGS